MRSEVITSPGLTCGNSLAIKSPLPSQSKVCLLKLALLKYRRRLVDPGNDRNPTMTRRNEEALDEARVDWRRQNMEDCRAGFRFAGLYRAKPFRGWLNQSGGS